MVAQLESLYICISLDYLMTLQDFFISGLPSGNVETKPQAITTTDQVESDRVSVGQDAKSSNAPATPPTPATKRTSALWEKVGSSFIEKFF